MLGALGALVPGEQQPGYPGGGKLRGGCLCCVGAADSRIASRGLELVRPRPLSCHCTFAHPPMYIYIRSSPHAEALQLAGSASFLEPRWWNVGYAKLASDAELAYLGIPGLRIAGGQGVIIIALCQVG